MTGSIALFLWVSQGLRIRRLESHSLGSHMLLVSVMLGLHLRVRHGYLIHLGSNRMRVRKGRAAVCLRRIRERRSERASLVMSMELGSHIRSTSGLVRRRSEAGAWRVGHLSLIAGL